MIKNILFDLDGTLLDSNRLINESNMYALNKYGDYQYTEEEVKKFNGVSLIDAYRELYPDKAEAIQVAYREYNDKHHDEMVSLFPNVTEVLQQLKEQGITMGIVSMKRRARVEHGLKLFNLLDLFDVVIGGDDCIKHKPHPEPLEQAMEKINADYSNTLMVGDNWQDIEAANNANIPSVFVSWSQKNLADIQPYKPHYVIDKMEELLEIVEEKKGVQ